MNRRDFISLCTCSCCSLLLPGCSTTPITKRKQLTIYPEAFINKQASFMYKNMIRRSKLSNDQKQLDEIIEIGQVMIKKSTSRKIDEIRIFPNNT